MVISGSQHQLKVDYSILKYYTLWVNKILVVVVVVVDNNEKKKKKNKSKNLI